MNSYLRFFFFFFFFFFFLFTKNKGDVWDLNFRVVISFFLWKKVKIYIKQDIFAPKYSVEIPRDIYPQSTWVRILKSASLFLQVL